MDFISNKRQQVAAMLAALGVADLPRAVAFYGDGLGLATEGIVGTELEHGAVVGAEVLLLNDPRRPQILLVDGENIDWALWNFLERKPEPKERPRWQRL